MLQDLDSLRDRARKAISSISNKELDFDEGFKNLVSTAYENTFGGSCQVTDNGLKVINDNGQVAYPPIEWFTRINACKDFILALNEYAELTSKLKVIVSDKTMKSLPDLSWRQNIENQEDIQKIDKFLNDLTNSTDKQRYEDFLKGDCWLPVKTVQGIDSLDGKKLDRQPFDYISSAVRHIAKLIAADSGHLDRFIKIYLANNNLQSHLSGLSSVNIRTAANKNNTSSQKPGQNIIFYGPPGVGKSHKIESVSESSTTVRTVFHPDTLFSDFVGCLKPRTEHGKVIYDFRIGPFTQAVVNAYNNPESHHYLVVEEINRASAAAVFGEIFQLLDRDASGKSRYSVTLSDPDLQAALLRNAPSAISSGRLRIPSNLSLLATMNSSDQAVLPMDTAFKRRWRFEYVPIDFSSAPQGKIVLPVQENLLEISWINFAQIINKELEASAIPEDRLLGPWFLSPQEIDSPESSREALRGKVLMYLWDDVLRHHDKTTLFSDEIMNFGGLLKLLDDNKTIFNDTVAEALLDSGELVNVNEP